MTALLSVRGLNLNRGGRQVLTEIHLDVLEGELLAIVGPNGAGKSSLLQSLALLTPARFLSYAFAGRPLPLAGGRPSRADGLALRRQLAVVFQEPLLLDATALENAASGLKLRGVNRKEALKRASAWLDRLGVGHLAGRHARELSGGEAQRVSLARALALSPRLLMLDEPFSPLDALTRSALLHDLRGMLAETGTTALLVTHDVTELAHLADRVLVLEAGRIVQAGTPAEVLAEPRTDLVRQMAAIARQTAAALTPLAGANRSGPE